MPFSGINRDVQELVPKRMEEDQANMTPDSSATANSKSELDNSFSFFQVTFDSIWSKYLAHFYLLSWFVSSIKHVF